MKRLQLLLLWVWMVCFSAASHDYMFKHLEVKDGLSNNQVNAIYKDSNGFMWFGTASGLNRYDGYNIKIYRSQKDDEKSLPDSYVEDKHHLCDPNAAWGEVPKMLFENNAKIAGRYFDQKLGVLEEGAAADVIIVNYNPLTPMNENNINGHLVFGVTGHDVVTTVANGKVLMKDRRLTEIDEAKVMADCRQAAAELGKRINSR